jgi:hypothetical protein
VLVISRLAEVSGVVVPIPTCPMRIFENNKAENNKAENNSAFIILVDFIRNKSRSYGRFYLDFGQNQNNK